MPFLIPIAGIAAWAYVKTRGAGAPPDLGVVHDDLDLAQDERDALRRRVETLEAIVTAEGYELDREARRAGIAAAAPALDLDALDPAPGAEPQARRRRTRS